MTWYLRSVRSHLKLLVASTLGVFLLGNVAPCVDCVSVANAQPANQAAGQTGSKAQGKTIPQPINQPRAGATLPAPRAGWSYPSRQTLTYEVDWRVFPAGSAVLHMESSGDGQRLTVTGESSGAINLLLRVSDHFQSTFSRQAGCSSGFAKQLVEGSRQVNWDQQFSSGQSRNTYDEKSLISHSHKVEQIATPPCVSDPLSAIVYAASQPLQVGQQLHMPVVYGVNVLDVTAHVEAREAVRTPTTTYQTLRVQPTWTNSTVKNSGNYWVWYTDDDRHIPVQVRARLFWGTITFLLTAVEQK